MRKAIGILLIIGALILGYFGINDLKDSSASIEVLGIEIGAKDTSAKEMVYVKIGLGVIALVAGVYLVGKKEK